MTIILGWSLKYKSRSELGRCRQHKYKMELRHGFFQKSKISEKQMDIMTIELVSSSLIVNFTLWRLYWAGIKEEVSWADASNIVEWLWSCLDTVHYWHWALLLLLYSQPNYNMDLQYQKNVARTSLKGCCNVQGNLMLAKHLNTSKTKMNVS